MITDRNKVELILVERRSVKNDIIMDDITITTDNAIEESFSC